MQPLSLVVTTFNNARTLDACLGSASCADEIVVLDSFSSDETLNLARTHNAVIKQQDFAGYGPQKQAAIDLAQHRWVLLLDADEALSEEANRAIVALMQTGPSVDAYELPRYEWMFWRMQSPLTHSSYFLRLFDKTKTHMSDMPIHAAPQCEGKVIRLKAPFIHYGERNIHTKVIKINDYSTGLVADKQQRGQRGHPWLRLVAYPPFYFLRLYFFKRQFVNGWAGFINSVVGAFYVFLKYAKLLEASRKPRGRETDGQ